MSLRLTDHHFARRGELLPPVDESLMLDYVVAANGTFARGRRPGLEVCLPVSLHKVRGLAPISPYAQWGYPKIPKLALSRMLALSLSACSIRPTEALFHLSWDTPTSEVLDGTALYLNPGMWCLERPEQHATKDRVEPVRKGAGSSEARAIVEVHSHHYDKAFFSQQDNEDEGGCSFRVYAVLGTIFDRPTIRARVGLFGHFFEYPASEFFELPEGLFDCVRLT
jgi:hypothetical protein